MCALIKTHRGDVICFFLYRLIFHTGGERENSREINETQWERIACVYLIKGIIIALLFFFVGCYKNDEKRGGGVGLMEGSFNEFVSF